MEFLAILLYAILCSQFGARTYTSKSAPEAKGQQDYTWNAVVQRETARQTAIWISLLVLNWQAQLSWQNDLNSIKNLLQV